MFKTNSIPFGFAPLVGIVIVLFTTNSHLSAQSGCDPEEIAKLIANDRAADDKFGISVSLDSNRAAIGAYFDDDNGNNSGAVYIFEESGGTWSQVGKVTPMDGQADDHLGRSVSLNGNQLFDSGDYFFGSRNATYFFHRRLTWWTFSVGSEESKRTRN